jgi:hypothetical protein
VGGGKLIVVTGLAVRTYTEEPPDRLRAAADGDAGLRTGLAWRGVLVHQEDQGTPPR